MEAEEDQAVDEYLNSCRTFPVQDWERDLYLKVLLCMTAQDYLARMLNNRKSLKEVANEIY